MRQHALNRSGGDKDWQNIAKVHGRPILRNGRSALSISRLISDHATINGFDFRR